MDNIQSRTAAVETAKSEVLAHPMCGKFEDDGGAFLVIYPAGDFPVDGVRVSYENGKAWALGILLQKMERHWQESYP